MSETLSAKKLLVEYNRKRYREFILNDNPDLLLPAVSFVPWVGASKRRDCFKKIISAPGKDCHIKFITKNREPNSFLWQTTAKKLHHATRWGIVKCRSITSKVIGTLGNYRVSAHKRIAKGMVSHSQGLKLKLLDLFQDRFEALQDLETLVNKKVTAKDYEKAINQYIERIQTIHAELQNYFVSLPETELDQTTKEAIACNLQADITRAKDYLSTLKSQDILVPYRSARGNYSILEFVKQQMIYGLYEFQGLNQDISYDIKHHFALTRGELNDFIEDARKEIDDHQPDLWNTVSNKHHGLYSANENELVTYDFAEDYLSPEREREVLLSISFIEGWDEIYDKSGVPTVRNGTGEESLDIVASPGWKTHRNFMAAFKSVSYYLLNIIKGFFISTNPWEEESWSNPTFHLYATELRKHAHPNEPLWQKPVRFFRHVFYAFADVFNGVRDFGSHLTIDMPAELVNDWESSKPIKDLDTVLREATQEISSIKEMESSRLAEILNRCNYSRSEQINSMKSKLASVEYELTPGEQNDILTAVAKGLNGFGSLFSHNIYSKDPVGGFLFTAAYGVGVAAIYMPTQTAAVFGSAYVNWFTDFSYSLGTSKLGAAIGGASTQAQTLATVWDSAIHGPSGIATNSAYQFGEDPLTFGSYFAASYGLGYLLANGVAGYKIPWLSDFLMEDLGSIPDTGYPLVGAKVAVLLYEALVKERLLVELPSQVIPPDERFLNMKFDVEENRRLMFDRFRLATWLSVHADALPKLDPSNLYALSQQIDRLFIREDSQSIHKLLYPETHFSIAFHSLSMPLSYIPSLIRVMVSWFLSFAAWMNGNESPLEPARRAMTNLLEKTAKDLSRLFICARFLLNLPQMFISSIVKCVSYIGIMLIGRIAGIFESKPAMAIHKMFASVHLFFRNINEYFFPTTILKSVESAHPNNTIKEVEATYLKMIKKMDKGLVVKIGQDGQEHTSHDPLFQPKKQLVKISDSTINNQAGATIK